MARGQFERGSMTTREAGLRGGAARKAAMTPEAYAELGRKGGTTTKERHGPEFYHQIGKEGGNTILQQRGLEHYAEMGRKGGRRTQELMSRGRELEAADQVGDGTSLTIAE